MNSAALLALNTVALAALVIFHFQSTTAQNTTQINQPVPHHLQQRPQLAVMTAAQPSPVYAAQGAQTSTTSKHWIF
ncbi:hypothetical protein C9383_08360 [Pseudomonas palleroniana]|uniref:Uncharacterized protein n=1 Tax=Pseudomonas palleroniana TaxID=191390 RepID=A0A1H5MKH4_9PSED|nr:MULTISPECIES: hypothetical protein [Pseudomonas]KAB0563410.1 hypothetical protein F7R03_26860 [Pseudomonas palleroniana]MBM9487762.1 hypothetical protein [Pseudomonas sp. ICBG1301]PTC28906.1 hypothetical protein C9383_08360 [Pseudomonas palleroniana]SEE89885.1 hypothetical protein SAMN04490198_3410 [Pseudomonas palleroniana]